MSEHSHAECREVIVGEFANKGGDVTASTEPPLIRNAYTTAPYVCPHGVSFWIEPTSEQIAQWARDEEML